MTIHFVRVLADVCHPSSAVGESCFTTNKALLSKVQGYNEVLEEREVKQLPGFKHPSLTELIASVAEGVSSALGYVQASGPHHRVFGASQANHQATAQECRATFIGSST